MSLNLWGVCHSASALANALRAHVHMCVGHWVLCVCMYALHTCVRARLNVFLYDAMLCSTVCRCSLASGVLSVLRGPI